MQIKYIIIQKAIASVSSNQTAKSLSLGSSWAQVQAWPPDGCLPAHQGLSPESKTWAEPNLVCTSKSKTMVLSWKRMDYSSTDHSILLSKPFTYIKGNKNSSSPSTFPGVHRMFSNRFLKLRPKGSWRRLWTTSPQALFLSPWGLSHFPCFSTSDMAAEFVTVPPKNLHFYETVVILRTAWSFNYPITLLQANAAVVVYV